MSWIGQDDFSYPVEGGFYSPVPASNDAPVRSSAGWWWDPNTPGWGVSYQIFRRSDGSDYLFGAVYGYDEAGNPRWYTFQTPVNGMQTLDIEAFNFRDGRPLNYNGWRQNTRWQTVPLTISWESPTKAVFRINNHDWPMQRAVFYRGTGTPDADWLLTNTWRLQGVRMEATRNTYYAWRYGENQWKKRGWGGSGPAILRPQAVFTDSATTWSRFDLNDLVMRDRNAIKALAGASDNAVYYLSDLRYDEKFMNYMKPEEWTEAEKTNPHRLDDYYQVYRSEPLWYDEVKDAGRFLLVYEPDTTEVTLLHLGGETIMDYPNGPLGDVKLLDETVLFRGHLGSPVDQQVRFTPEVCTGCDTEQARSTPWTSNSCCARTPPKAACLAAGAPKACGLPMMTPRACASLWCWPRRTLTPSVNTITAPSGMGRNSATALFFLIWVCKNPLNRTITSKRP